MSVYIDSRNALRASWGVGLPRLKMTGQKGYYIMSRPAKKGIGVRTSVYFPVDLCLDMANAMAALGSPKLNSFIREAVQYYCDTVMDQYRMLEKEGAKHGEESTI